MIDDDARNALDLALREAVRGRAVLFLGSGASHYAKPKKHSERETLPDGEALKSIIFENLGEAPEQNIELPRLATYYLEQRSKYQLRDLLLDNLLAGEVDPKLENLLNLPWRRVYTTNFDNIIETVRTKHQSFTATEIIKSVSAGACLHINGSVSKLDPTTIDDDLTLSDWSYASNGFAKSPWARFFVQDLNAARSIIFFGFSLKYDLDIAKILVSDAGYAKKTILVVGDNTNRIDLATLKKYGRVIENADNLVFSRLKRISRDLAGDAVQRPLDALREIELPTDAQPLDVARRRSHFIYGDVDESRLLVSAAVSEPVAGNYFLSDAMGEFTEGVRRGDVRDGAVIGPLGAGKSVSLLVAAGIWAAHSGARVFWVNRKHGLADDLFAVSQMEERVIVVFDDYQRYIDEIGAFASQRRPVHSIIIAARNTLHDLLVERVEQLLGGPIQQVDLSRMDDASVYGVDELFERAGLWASLFQNTPAGRGRYITQTVDRSLPRLLIGLVGSKDIQERIKSEIDAILDSPEDRRIFRLLLVANAMEHTMMIDDLAGMVGTDEVARFRRVHSKTLGHFVSIGDVEITRKSSLLGIELVRMLFSGVELADTAVELFDFALENDYDADQFEFSVRLMRYNQIEKILHAAESKRFELMLYYYSRLGETGGVQHNSQYWLQFGIAASIHADLTDPDALRAVEDYFENAYSRERNRANPRLTNIDNYFSRFLLMKASAQDSASEAFRLFVDGSNRLFKQIFLSEAQHYPFKAGRSYVAIAEKFWENWGERERKIFLNNTSKALKLAREYEERNGRQSDVSFMQRELQSLLERLAEA